MKTFEVILKDGTRFNVRAKDLYINSISGLVYFIEPETELYLDMEHVVAIHEVKESKQE